MPPSTALKILVSVSVAIVYEPAAEACLYTSDEGSESDRSDSIMSRMSISACPEESGT